MHVTPTDFRDLARMWWTLDIKAILAAGGQGTVIWKPTKKVANRILEFPSLVHIAERGVFAQSSLEIVWLMIMEWEPKELS